MLKSTRQKKPSMKTSSTLLAHNTTTTSTRQLHNKPSLHTVSLATKTKNPATTLATTNTTATRNYGNNSGNRRDSYNDRGSGDSYGNRRNSGGGSSYGNRENSYGNNNGNRRSYGDREGSSSNNTRRSSSGYGNEGRNYGSDRRSSSYGDNNNYKRRENSYGNNNNSGNYTNRRDNKGHSDRNEGYSQRPARTRDDSSSDQYNNSQRRAPRDYSSNNTNRRSTHHQEAEEVNNNDGDDNDNEDNDGEDQPHIPQKRTRKPHSSGTTLGEALEVKISDLSHEGHGVAKLESGFPFFVPNGLPGETIRIRPTLLKKTYGHAEIDEILTKSESRIDPPCKFFLQCGGCSLQHMEYNSQLKWKHKMFTDVIQRIGKINTDVIINPVIGMDDPWRYRNKTQIPIGIKEQEGGDNKQLISGFYSARSHDVVDMKECLISPKETDQILTTLTSQLNSFGIQPYDESTHTGALRHIIVRKGTASDQAMVIMVTRTEHLPHTDKIIQAIKKTLPNVKSIYQNVNPMRTNTIMGQQNVLLWGNESITDSIGRTHNTTDNNNNNTETQDSNNITTPTQPTPEDLVFEISPQSFFQTNPLQTKVLYQKALEYSEITQPDKVHKKIVIDAYCGVGTISLFMAPYARHIFGVEIVPDSVNDAQLNAKRNNLEKNTFFQAGKAEDVIPQWYQKIPSFRADVLVVDPPRKGCDAALIDTIIGKKIPKVVYVSCNPSTLARDLALFEAGGYLTKKIQPVDMFPHTFHTEAVAVLDYHGQKQ